MKKFVKFFKKITLVILLMLPIFLISINSELIIGDEIWNFQNVMKMINGGKIYVDCNVIITPIFYCIGKIFLRIFGANILSFRIYNIVIFSAIILSSFFIFRLLKIDKLKSTLYSLVILLFIMPYISVGANYNVLAIVFYLCGILLILNREKIKYYNFLQGCIIYLVIFTKQNIGALYVLAIIIVEIYSYKKQAINHILKEGIVAFILAFITIMIMMFQGNFQGFLNYTILGMGEFTGNNLSIQETVEFVIFSFGIIAIASYLLSFLLLKSREIDDKNIVILLIFALTLNFSAYPIFNLYHTSFAILLNIIIFIYIFEQLLLKKVVDIKMKVGLVIIMYIVINSFGINCGIIAGKNIRFTDKKSVYYSANINKQLNKNLEEITQYILQKEKDGIDVICISADSALYMTALNKNHQELDLIFEGNLGYNGKQNTIEKIKNLDNVEILMNKNIYWQELSELREYIIQNYKNVDAIGDCYIFKK